MKKFLAIYTGTNEAAEKSGWKKLDQATRKAREASGGFEFTPGGMHGHGRTSIFRVVEVTRYVWLPRRPNRNGWVAGVAVPGG